MAWKNIEARRANDKAYARKEHRTAYVRDYNEANKEKKAAYDKAYREATKEHRTAWAKAYHEANKEKINIYGKVWYESNKEKRAASRKAWNKRNLGRRSAYLSRSRALKRKLVPEHLKNCPIEKKRVDDIHKLCVLISKVTGVKHHVDHMWPLSAKGPEWSGNMQIITAHENLSNGASVCPELKRNIKQSLKESKNVFQ